MQIGRVEKIIDQVKELARASVVNKRLLLGEDATAGETIVETTVKTQYTLL